MSWSGFKKAVNRAGAHVIMKTSKNNEESVDLEFDQREQNFQVFENLINELNNELSNFKTLFHNLIETQFILVKTIDSFYGNYNFQLQSDNLIGLHNDNDSSDTSTEQLLSKTNQRDGISLQLLKNINDIQTEILPQLNEPLNITVFQPIADLNDYNNEIHKLIKKRGRKKFDFDVSKSKLDKLQNEYNSLELSLREEGVATSNQLDKNKEKLIKLNNEFLNTSQIYDDLNQRLKNEIDEYISLRFSLLDPSFESFFKIQMKLYTDLHSKFSHNINLDSLSIEDHENGKLDKRLDEILNKMKALDINNL